MKIAKICSTRVFAAVLTAGMLVIPAYVATTRALAQTAATGTISGTITDASGAAVPNTTVVITNTDTGASRTVTTDNDGDYSPRSIASLSAPRRRFSHVTNLIHHA